MNIPNGVPTADVILLLITPPVSESKLALSAQAHALVPVELKTTVSISV